jgi:spore germination cell wall hydrolase CwlJ-like protein
MKKLLIGIIAISVFAISSALYSIYTVHQSAVRLKALEIDYNKQLNTLYLGVYNIQKSLNDFESEARNQQLTNAAHLKKILLYENTVCLADNIYYEAGFQPVEGQAAVAQVVMNRLHDPNRPKNICGVVYERGISPKNGKIVCQFSWTCKPIKGKNNKIYAGILDMARRFLTNKETSDIIGTDVEFYHAAYITPDWAAEKEMVAMIGDHVFYR